MVVTYKFINKALSLIAKGEAIEEIEARFETGFVHKIVKYLRLPTGEIPARISEAQYLIALGKLKSEEIEYRKRQADFKKNQTRLDKFFGVENG
jgi:hypothetical protein